MENQVLIREAVPDDLAAVTNIIGTVLGEFDIPTDDAEVASELRGILEPGAAASSRLWVVVDDDVIVGSAAVVPIRDGVCELKRMYLLPQLRGRGLGRRLLNQVLGFVRQSGCPRIELETHTKMEAARSLYQSADFKPQCSELRNCGCDQSMYLDL